MPTITRIRQKVRMLTGRKSSVQLTDSEIDFQVNNWYKYFLPAQFRTFDLRSEYTFITTPNTDVYDVTPNTYQSFEPTAYVAGYPTYFVEDRTIFHQMYPDIRNDVFLTQGTGIVGPYTGTISATPILKGSVLVYAETAFSSSVNCVDDSAGNLRSSLPDGPIIGSVNYETGAVTVTNFTGVVPSTSEIRVQSRQYNANRPQTVFYWDNQITLRPVPDRCYQIRIVAYLLPTALITSNPNASPELEEWWEMLAIGASKKIFENNKDLESAAQMQALLEEQEVQLSRRQWFQLRSQRTSTIYSAPTYAGSPYPYYYYGGYW